MSAGVGNFNEKASVRGVLSKAIHGHYMGGGSSHSIVGRKTKSLGAPLGVGHLLELSLHPAQECLLETHCWMKMTTSQLLLFYGSKSQSSLIAHTFSRHL